MSLQFRERSRSRPTPKEYGWDEGWKRLLGSALLLVYKDCFSRDWSLAVSVTDGVYFIPDSNTLHFLDPSYTTVIHHYDDFDLVIEGMSSFIIDVGVICYLINFSCNSKKIHVLLDQVKENWSIFPMNNGLQLVHEYSQSGKQSTLLYSGFLYAAWFVFVTEPLHVKIFRLFVPSNKTLPITFAIPVDYGPLDVEKYYYVILVIAAISIFGIVTVIISGDILLFLYAQHACGLFAGLGFSNTIEDVFCWIFLVTVGLNMIVISMTAVQVVTNLNAVGLLLKTLVFTVSTVMHLFLQCFMSQQIADRSLDTQQHLMNAKWYSSTGQTKQMLQFMMMRAQNPSQLTAGRMVLMSLNTFSSIIRTSATYFTIFLDMQ